MATKAEANDFVAFLNVLTTLDPGFMESFARTRFMCNKDLAAHPLVQVIEAHNTNNTRPATYAGLMGLLNGYFADIDEQGKLKHYIVANWDDVTGKFLGFEVQVNNG